eukprot:TRINITY_DN14108_c0_g1_i1.p1 TRINITY_DN14108_c0_g1~~TRINITY_DN14108_c0_g1_i1.p1  ORF type:complete len:110 (+),score=18.94 TRINITY_DN14108_c0_g1_i1:74-403(+)
MASGCGDAAAAPEDGGTVPEFEYPSAPGITHPEAAAPKGDAGVNCTRGVRVSVRVCLASSLHIACVPVDVIESAIGIVCCPFICGLAACVPGACAEDSQDAPQRQDAAQ